MTEPDAGNPILDRLLGEWQAPAAVTPPEPDEFDVHPDMIGEPLLVDYDTGETLTYGEVADRVLGQG